jgi:hypothetical protein
VNATCYMCDLPGTSREHAPPACLFPEHASLGRDLRRNLITVPSCDTHNSHKSKDDEFLRAVLTMAAGPSSSAATHQFFGKVVRAAERQPVAYGAFFSNLEVQKKKRGDRPLQLDRRRFDSCIDHIAKAIYFHTYATKWSLPMFVVSPNFYLGSENEQLVAHEPTIQAVEATKRYLESEPNRGENAEVFVYRIRHTEGTFGFAALFYERFEVFAASSVTLVEGAA